MYAECKNSLSVDNTLTYMIHDGIIDTLCIICLILDIHTFLPENRETWYCDDKHVKYNSALEKNWRFHTSLIMAICKVNNKNGKYTYDVFTSKLQDAKRKNMML